MERPCYRCGAVVSEGVAFCPGCGAPQIRVAANEPPSAPSEAPADLSGAPRPAIRWSDGLPAAGLAGLVAAGLMVLPAGAFGLGMLAAGALAVFLYHRRNPGPMTPGMGARLGAVGGALGFAAFTLLSLVGMAVFGSGGKLRQALLDALQQSVSRAPDPQVQQVLESLKSPTGLAIMVALGFGFLGILFLLFSGLGGALGAMLLRTRERR